MKISSELFEAFLKCPTKCWLRAAGEPGAGNAYAEWVKSQNSSYREAETERLLSETPKDKYALSPPAENLKAAKWYLAASLVAQAQMNSCVLESKIHAVERVPSEGRGKPVQFIPIRFIFTNKLGKDEKLLLAFDAFVLAELLGREGSLGRIIHGDDHAALKVRTAGLAGEVPTRIEKIVALLSSPSPPDLVLNRHCAECEFQVRCRKIAVEKDDLSLLAGMSAKERERHRSKGIFTVNQLSYTFRPTVCNSSHAFRSCRSAPHGLPGCMIVAFLPFSQTATIAGKVLNSLALPNLRILGRGLSGFPPFRGQGHSRLRGKPAHAEAAFANRPADRQADGRKTGQRPTVIP